MPRTLFSDLQLPDVSIRLPALGRIAARIEAMPLAQALREFAPGRVSRRFGVAHGGERYWIAPGATDEVLIDGFCSAADRQDLGMFVFRAAAGGISDIPVFRPHALDVAVTPLDIQQSSNAFLEWRTQIVLTGQGHEADAPEGSPWSAVLQPLRFHTHHLGLPIELRRFAIGATASVGRGTGRQVERRLRFACSESDGRTAPAALGFVADVDGVQVSFTYPPRLYDVCMGDERLARGLRPGRFRDVVRAAHALDGIANGFQRDWLAQAYLSTIGAEALRTEGTLERAEAAVHARSSATSIVEVLETILQWVEGDRDSDDASDGTASDDDAVPKRLRELIELMDRDETKAALHDAARVLWEPLGAEWEAWLRDRFKSTLGSGLAEAAHDLCPRMDPGALLIDLNAHRSDMDRNSARPTTDGDDLWLTEATIGGGGFVEEFLTRYAEDPRRFFRLLDAALAPSDLESVGFELERVLEIATAAAPEHAPVAAAFSAVRSADSHAASVQALNTLRTELARRGVQPTPTLMVALNARVLRPGTTSDSDVYLARLIRDWLDAERRLGIEIDARVFALVRSGDGRLEQALRVNAVGDSDQARAAWRYGVLYGMLWPRGAQVRIESLRSFNAFERLPECDRLLVLAAVSRPVVGVTLDGEQWFQELARVLVRDGVAEIVAPVPEAHRLALALLRISSEPVDSEALLVHARLTGVRRDGHQLSAYSGDGDRPFRPHRDHPVRAIAITSSVTAGAV